MYLYVGDLPGWKDSWPWGEIDLEANDIWRDWLFSQSLYHLGKSKQIMINPGFREWGEIGWDEMKGLSLSPGSLGGGEKRAW